MMIMKMTDTPWANLHRASDNNSFVTKLVGSKDNPSKGKIYWALDQFGRPSLLVEYSIDKWQPAKLVSLKNIDVEDYPEVQTLAIILRERQLLEVFFTLCMDVIKGLQNVSPDQMRSVCILVLEKWEALLQRERRGLGPDQQKGLIAELLFLQRTPFEILSVDDALAGWVGPERAPRDFVYGQSIVEIKSKGSSSSHHITISSEEQLNTNENETLFLVVTELNQTANEDEAGFTLTQVVESLKEAISSPFSQACFDSKLASVGYFADDDYSASRWTEGSTYCYSVIGDFPRVTSENCMKGVESVAYRIDLDYCTDYKTELKHISESIEG